ncbi:MAG: hypothetical protein JWL63_2704 [Rhodocyclales bacterium]|nr:hypothetical protein [Rhodocyclales bacterium]
MQFEKAVRKQAKLRLALSGPSGSGKTMGALLIAKGLGGRIAVMDTERDSASLYSESFKLSTGKIFTPPEFYSLSLAPPYAPERFVEAIRAAESAGYDVLIIDSITHEWNGSGGCLEINDELARAKFRGNTWSAWNETTPRHRAVIDAIQQSRMHIIATMRSKTETTQSEEGGKKKVLKLGMKAEQRDGFEYEFTTVLDIIHDGNFATSSKDRTGLFSGDPKPITEQTGVMLREWLVSGAAMVEPELPHLDETEVVDMLSAIGAANSLEELRQKFGMAWTHGKGFPDAQARYKVAYDTRTAALSAMTGA